MATKADFDLKYNIIDEETPCNAFMSGHYKRSYAYNTLRSRLPVVLTNVIDTLTKDKQELVSKFGESSREELKIIIGHISRLKYELQTDKAFELFRGNEPDGDRWNIFISHLPEDQNSFYKACWLHAECYMYRKLYSFFENSIFLREFDYFHKVKKDILSNSLDEILALTHYTRRTEKTLMVFEELLKLALWSNRNDLSGDDDMKSACNKVLDDVSALDSFILINNTAQIWECLNDPKRAKSQPIDIICDNAGYDMFTDLILAEYLIEKGLATKVRFHVKAHPWYVSDITELDFQSTLQYLSEQSDYIISLIGKKFVQFLEEGKFELAPTSYFWTGPHAYFNMREVDSSLYKALTESKLIVFKGDLNYRKLLGDVCWDSTQDFRTCLRGFLPTNICTVRTIKAEVICGLPQSISDNLKNKDPQWMTTGNYGIIKFVDAKHEFGY